MRSPGDFRINQSLALCPERLQPPRLDEAIRYYSASVALRPQSAGARFNLAMALERKGLLDDAIAEYQESTRLEPD